MVSTAVRESRTRWTRPGWPEAFAAGITYALAFLLVALIFRGANVGDPTTGLALAAASGVMGLLAFAAAYLIRIRSWPAFGIRTISLRWALIAVGGGIAAIVLARLAALGVTQLLGDHVTDVQGSYRAAATAGPLALVLQLLFIAVLTPIGEEFAFRAVLTNVLSRYGAWVSVVVSTLVFALAHGINLVLIPAVIVGGINAFLFLKTKSVWPGVIVHAVNNGVTTLLPLAV